MSSFVFKGKDNQGVVRSERVLAENAQAARASLEQQGWTDLTLVLEELADTVSRLVEGPDEFKQALSPDEEVRFFEGKFPGFWSQYFKDLWGSKGSLLLSLAMVGYGIYRDRLWLIIIGGVLLTFITLLFPALHLFFSLPLQYYSRLNKAKVWSRWSEVLACVERLEQVSRFTKIGPGKLELARCRSQALAATGHLDQGLREFKKFAFDPAIPEWTYLSFLAGIYDCAQDKQNSLACRRQAAELKPDTSATWIDLAYGLAHTTNSPAAALEALAKAESLEIPGLGRPYLSFLRGVICWREGRYSEARPHLEQALEAFKPFAHAPLIEAIVLLTKSYLCATLGALGQTRDAAELLRETELFLTGARETDLLEACRRGLGASLPAPA